MVIKGGFIAWAQMGDANASILIPKPVHMRPMFGGFGGAIASTSLTFISQAAMEQGIPEQIGLQTQMAAVSGTHQLSKQDMKLK